MPKVKRACDNCGASIVRYPSQFKETNFCSRDCMVEYRNNTDFYKKENHPMWSGDDGDTSCEHCGKTFHVKPSAFKRGRGRFCSSECRKNASIVEHTCEVCGSKFLMKKSHSEMGHGRYCSMDCRTVGFRRRGLYDGEGNGNYRHGESFTPEYVRRASHKRRVQKQQNGGNYTIEEWVKLCEQYGNKCLACGADDELLTVDHIVPVVKGGSNDISNLQPLCKSCNSSKHDKIIDYR